MARPDYQFTDVLLREVLLVVGAAAADDDRVRRGVSVRGGAGRRTATRRVAENLGVIYAINTLGAIVGALLAGFVLVPMLGLHSTIRLVAAIGGGRRDRRSCCLGARAAAAGMGRICDRRPVVLIAAALAAASGIRSLLSSGAYKYARRCAAPDLESALTAGELLSYREGSTGTVDGAPPGRARCRWRSTARSTRRTPATC